MKRIAVYCGSNKGARPAYAQAAEKLGSTEYGRYLKRLAATEHF